MSDSVARGFFVTGTDTEVGKTFVTCWLLRQLNAQGLRSLGMKPVAAGGSETADGFANEDALALAAAGWQQVPYAWLNPYLLRQPVSPHIAAAREHVSIDFARIADAYRQLAAMADVVLVEGAGGWRAPLSETLDIADLARHLRLPVILVVGMRLGCLNHALLTADAIVASGLPLVGWVANRVDPHMREYAANLHFLRQRIPAPLLAQLPHAENPNVLMDVALQRWF